MNGWRALLTTNRALKGSWPTLLNLRHAGKQEALPFARLDGLAYYFANEYFANEIKAEMMSQPSIPFADQVFHKFLDMMRFKRQYAHRFIDEHGIKPRELSMLLFLSETERATVGQAQAYIHQSASTTSALIAKLEKAGLVTRTRSKKDNRVVNVALTADGRDVVAHTPLGGLPLMRRNMRQLPEERLVQIHDVLVELMQMMESDNASS